jgi:two-component system, OmpR family, osmolarity sensor histidine kinase EnvZ
LSVRLWPRSLFGRLALLLLAVILISQVTAIYLYRRDRAELLERQFSDTKLLELRALRAALAAAEPHPSETALARLGEAYGARIVPDEGARFVGTPPQSHRLIDLEHRLKAELGLETALRFEPGARLLWVRLAAGDRGYWAGFRVPQLSTELPGRALEWSLIIFAVLLASAYAFARYLARPLRELSAAVASVGVGRPPPPLPEMGPSEIVALNRGFNQMLANLRQMEQDRAVLLAGVSHDLRTPLARLRLGTEVGGLDENTRQGMVEDIEEMDKIINQFLDFARDEHDSSREACDLNELLAGLVERYRRAGRELRFSPGALPALALRPTACSRLAANLIDNALRYGAPPVEVATRREGASIILEVSDCGPGIAPEQIERLKRPFTRGDPARSGAPGAGLGLAIVERIARLHGGALELLPRTGGGLIARVTLPLRAATS